MFSAQTDPSSGAEEPTLKGGPTFPDSRASRGSCSLRSSESKPPTARSDGFLFWTQALPPTTTATRRAALQERTDCRRQPRTRTAPSIAPAKQQGCSPSSRSSLRTLRFLQESSIRRAASLHSSRSTLQAAWPKLGSLRGRTLRSADTRLILRPEPMKRVPFSRHAPSSSKNSCRKR